MSKGLTTLIQKKLTLKIGIWHVFMENDELYIGDSAVWVDRAGSFGDSGDVFHPFNCMWIDFNC